MELFTPIYVLFVYLENGDLVQKHVSRRPPPPVGKKLILDIDERFTRFTVLDLSTATQHDYQYYVLKVSKDQIADQQP